MGEALGASSDGLRTLTVLPVRVGEDDDARAEPRRVYELQVSRVDAVQEPLAASGDDRKHPEVALVDEIVLHQCAIERAGTELQDALAWLALQLGDLLRHVPFDEGGVPRRLRLQPGSPPEDSAAGKESRGEPRGV